MNGDKRALPVTLFSCGYSKVRKERPHGSRKSQGCPLLLPLAGVTLRPMLAAAAEKRVAVSAATDLAACGGLVKPVALHLQYVVNAKDKTLVSLL